MKKVFSFAAAVAAVFSLGSCDQLADMLSTLPTFTVAPVVYNGQEQKLVRTSFCAYEWEVNHREFCTINVDQKDSTAMAHFYLDEGTKACELTITATNPLHPEKTVEQKTSLRKWTMKLYDAEDKEVTTPVAGKTYTLKLIDKVDNTPIERIYTDIKLKNGYVYETVGVKFNGNEPTADFGFQTVAENTVYKFTLPAGFSSSKLTIAVTVGTKSETVSYTL